MTRAAVYCRISQDRSGEGLGVARQEKDCRDLAARLGFEVGRVFVDDDVSAYTGRPRPQYLAMLEALEAGEFGAVLCWHTDRLHRSPVELERYISTCEPRGIMTHSVTSGPVDLSTASGLLNARIAGAVAAHESQHKSERIGRKMRELVEAGKYTGGVVPFGWELGPDRVPVLVPAEAAMIREATERFLAGESIGSLTRWANTQGLPTRTGKRWGHVTLRQALRRSKNAGVAVRGGEVIGPSTFPAIVSEDQWRAVVAILDSPGRRTHDRASTVKYLLSGIARCGTCGGPMGVGWVQRRNGQKVSVYKCRDTTGAGRDRDGRSHPARMTERVDDYVEAVVLARLARADVVDLFAVDRRDEVQALEVERDTIRRNLDALADQAGEGNITVAQMGKASKRLRERLDDVSSRLVSAASGSVLGEFAASGSDPEVWWTSVSLERRRAVVDALCTVTLLPVGRGRARVFHPDTVPVEWKAAEAA